MKLRLILKTKTKNDKEMSVKFNIAPSKHLGFINFVNQALKQDNPIILSFEKISTSGEKEDSKISGVFQFQGSEESEKLLQKLEETVKEKERQRKKQKQKKKHR
ncbi:MAG: hypothetical protein JW891_15920 [Candidatus Lokiarchaeota archaeon]|nr:hypothetical protein [Candidatus Lokiarchaeota archaeon]